MDISASQIIDLLFVAIIVMMAVNYRLSMRRYESKTADLIDQLAKTQVVKIKQLEDQLAMVSKGSQGVGRRLMNAEKKLNQTMERQSEMENKDTEQFSFNQAAKLLEKGIELNDVVGKVGITRSEAKLVDLFQQKECETLE
ncbi:hypothetical protein A9Q81_07465 [Gammaproteobacteria bacterium 42_54_T18]|nr:hypothetical protein A9Q81_07465 [Gammaproteobacteria bacterium 42_54_T18]